MRMTMQTAKCLVHHSQHKNTAVINLVNIMINVSTRDSRNTQLNDEMHEMKSG